MTGASKANVDEILYVPASLALNQRPAVPGILSTFGTGIVRKECVCTDCGGTRLSEDASAPRLRGIGLYDACKMTLSELADWVDSVPASLPEEMCPMAENIGESFRPAARRLMELGLGYLSLDRASSTLSTGERQRMQLARAVRTYYTFSTIRR